MDEFCEKKRFYEPTTFVNYDEYLREFDVSSDINQFIQQYQRTLAKLQEKNINIDDKSKSSNQEQIAVCYHNLASAYLYQGNSKVSEEFYSKALKEYKENKCKKTNDLNIATIYHNLSWMHNEFEQTEEALKFCHRSLEIKKECIGDVDHPDIALSYDCLGLIYYLEEDYEEALKFGEIGLTMRKELYKNKPHSFLAESYSNVGLALDGLDRYEEAIESFKSAEKIARQLNGEDQDVAFYLKSQAAVHFDVGAIYESIQCSTKALRIYSRLNIRSSEPGLAYQSLGDVQREKMNLKDSKQNLIRAYRFYLRAGERERTRIRDVHSDIVHVEKDLAVTCNNSDEMV